ncbi:glycosyltransferase family 4 protein [Candidimonas humi]|uniref:Glycosyltransferase family 4 protein n=1 Tax=Candidimonas humi TaxID=683355 RepID=A0ABV8P2Q3_9BURK|nr:glycosyltransferase family 4 protein [Candidimonas humi]MBV6306763.1 glycosyltransferase family 4 protein [Candidimonas humi]
MTTPNTECRKPLRILHTEAATSFGGQEHRIFKEMLAMRERGHHLELVCQAEAALAERTRSEGFRVHEVVMAGPRSFAVAAMHIARILRQGGFDVVNTHSRTDTMSAAAAGRLVRTPLIVRTRHLAIPPGSLISYTGLPHRVIAVSEHVRRLLIGRGAAPEKIATVMDAIVLPRPVDAAILRHELGLSPDAIVIGSVGHMRERKGHPDLVAASIPLIRSRPNLHLVIAGEGEPLLTSLREQVASEGLGDRIHLLGRRRDIANLLSGFDIFALATKSEALGTAYLEAAACGLPLVGTNVGGVPEIIEEGVNGLLVEPGNRAQLADALSRLVDDPALRARLGEAARAKVAGDPRFSVGYMAEATESLYYQWLR